MIDAPFVQLFLVRWRTFVREPNAVFWVVVLPILFGVPVALVRGTVDLAATLALTGSFGAIWTVAWPIVQARMGGLLRRLAVTPMATRDYLAAMLVHRILLAMLESVLLVAIVRIASSAAPRASFGALVLAAIVGAIAHASTTLVVAARARNMETALGVLNLVLWPMILSSGAILRPPEAARAIAPYLPVGAHLSILRWAIDGAPVDPAAFLVLGGWSAACLLVAIRLFRWSA